MSPACFCARLNVWSSDHAAFRQRHGERPTRWAKRTGRDTIRRTTRENKECRKTDLCHNHAALAVMSSCTHNWPIFQHPHSVDQMNVAPVQIGSGKSITNNGTRSSCKFDLGSFTTQLKSEKSMLWDGPFLIPGSIPRTCDSGTFSPMSDTTKRRCARRLVHVPPQ